MKTGDNNGESYVCMPGIFSLEDIEMKVFEVTTEDCRGGNGEIRTTVQYVTSEKGTLQSVTDYFTKHCESYEQDLKGIREVLTIVQHVAD